MSEERLQFQAEVSRLLDIVARSLYSHKEVFLRELISNASDACDRLRYAALTEPELAAEGTDFRISLSVDHAARTLTVADNGIGMSRDDLVANLGTIAKSGTTAFLDQLSGDARNDLALIGQFGVGFYSAFMVADQVEVLTRRAGERQGWRWQSDGKGEFVIGEAGEVPRGTQVIVHLSEGEDEFLDPHRLRSVVKTYSDHIALPIVMAMPRGEDQPPEDETLNRASALWTRPKSEITAEEHKEFYHHVAHAFDEPWLTLHYRAEGVLEYTALLYVPSMPPFDLYQPERRHRVKLYVRRVFVTDEAEGLVPPYLRFLRGLVDSQDLPLNVSREMLQNNPLVAKIRQGLTRRVLSELARKAKDEPESFESFWKSFGAVLKEGLYDDFENRETLLGLLHVESSAADGLTTLPNYLGRMKEGQEAIYYVTGDSVEALRKSPHLEGFRAKGVEVLLLTDPVDEFWVQAVGSYQDKPFKSITRGGADLSSIKPAEGEGGDTSGAAEASTPEGIGRVIAVFRDSLKDEVKDVRPSERLTDSPVCLVADEHDMDIHLERLLKQHKQLEGLSKRILEVNPRHPLVQRMNALLEDTGHQDTVAELAHLLLDQARIVEGDPVPDPAAFSRRLSQALARGLTLAA